MARALTDHRQAQEASPRTLALPRRNARLTQPMAARGMAARVRKWLTRTWYPAEKGCRFARRDGVAGARLVLVPNPRHDPTCTPTLGPPRTSLDILQPHGSAMTVICK